MTWGVALALAWVVVSPPFWAWLLPPLQRHRQSERWLGWHHLLLEAALAEAALPSAYPVSQHKFAE